jgi:hypothetical protein
MSAVLFALMTELQLLDEVSPPANFVIVMVEIPELGVVVVKLPDPAVVTFIGAAVFSVAVFPPVKL